MFKDYSLSGEQVKAIKEVEKAFKNAAKLGVSFWDNCGILTAYNSNDIHQPIPDKSNGGSVLDYNKVFCLKTKNLGMATADDQLYVLFKD